MKMIKYICTAVLLAGAMMLSACGSKGMSEEEKYEQEMMEAMEAYYATQEVAPKVPDATAPELEVVAVYANNDQGEGLKQYMDSVEELTAEALIAKLAEYGMVDAGCTVEKYEVNEDGTKATLELKGLSDTGTKTVYAIVNTFTMNYSDLLTITVKADGKTIAEDQRLFKDFKEVK